MKNDPRRWLCHLERGDFTYALAAGDTVPDALAHEIAGSLQKSGLISKDRSDYLAAALVETLINALDYGCLGLESNLRPGDLSSPDHYRLLKQERLADPLRSGQEIRIRIVIDARRVKVSVQDPGEGVPRNYSPSRELTPNGRGILLMRQFADRVVIRRNPSVVSLIMNRDDRNRLPRETARPGNPAAQTQQGRK